MNNKFFVLVGIEVLLNFTNLFSSSYISSTGESETLNLLSLKCFKIEKENDKILKIPSDFPTITEAVEKAKDGDIIIISPGTYYESEIELSKSVTISSEWKIDGDISKIKETIIDVDNKKLFSIKADNVEISGLTILNGNHTLDISAKVSVIYNHFIRNLDAISLESGSGGYVAYNVIENDRDDGIDIDIGSNKNKIGSDIIVEHNTITNSNDDGIEIRLFSHPDQNITYIIRENVIIGSKNAAIQIISYDVYTGKVFHIHHNIFRDCKVGLGCMGGRNTREDLSGASKMDERVFYYNNTMVSNQMGATGGNNIIAFNNIVLENALGGFKNFGENSAIINNLFYNNGDEDFKDIKGSVPKSGNIFTLDPLIDKNSFKPFDNSPCIDAGIRSYILNGDTLINISPEYIKASNPDIGAIETGREYIVPIETNLIVDAGNDIIYKESDNELFLKGKIINPARLEVNYSWKLEQGDNFAEILHPESLETKVKLSQYGLYEFSLNCSVNDLKISDYIIIRYVTDGNGKQLFLNNNINNVFNASDYAYSYGNVIINSDPEAVNKRFITLNNEKDIVHPKLEYFIVTSEFDDCSIWVYAKKITKEKGGLKIKFNDQEADELSLIKNKKWKWIKVPGIFNVTAGQWSLLIENIEGPVSVEKILFSFDPAFSPK